MKLQRTVGPTFLQTVRKNTQVLLFPRCPTASPSQKSVSLSSTSLSGQEAPAPHTPVQGLKGQSSLPDKCPIFFQVLLREHLSAVSFLPSIQHIGPRDSATPPTTLRHSAHKWHQTNPCTLARDLKHRGEAAQISAQHISC